MTNFVKLPWPLSDHDIKFHRPSGFWENVCRVRTTEWKDYRGQSILRWADENNTSGNWDHVLFWRSKEDKEMPRKSLYISVQYLRSYDNEEFHEGVYSMYARYTHVTR